jgi:hypothetical protein
MTKKKTASHPHPPPTPPSKIKVAKAAIKLGVTVLNPKKQYGFWKRGAKGEGWTYPGTKYLGPGNQMNKGLPTSYVDAAARDHDLEYANYLKRGVKPKRLYSGYSDADSRLLKRTNLGTAEGIATHLGIGVKKLGHTLKLNGPRIRDQPGDRVTPDYKHL